MTLAAYIKKIVQERDITYSQFARACGLTKAYISQLVNENNPRTGRAPKPTIEVYQKIANAARVTIEEMFAELDDAPITLKAPSEEDATWEVRDGLRNNPDRRTLLKLARYGSDADVRQAAALVDALRATNPEFYDGDDPA